jgi:hypothetical protein
MGSNLKTQEKLRKPKGLSRAGKGAFSLGVTLIPQESLQLQEIIVHAQSVGWAPGAVRDRKKLEKFERLPSTMVKVQHYGTTEVLFFFFCVGA